MRFFNHCIILALTGTMFLISVSVAAEKPTIRDLEQNRRAFAEFVANHFTLLKPDLREMAALYGYAIGREAVRVKKGTSQYYLWKDLIDFHEQRFVNIAGKNYLEGIGTGAYPSQAKYEKAVVTAFQRGYSGMVDQHLAGRTGVSPNGSPFFFSAPEKPSFKIITITLDHIRKTSLGRRVHNLNERLKSIASEATAFPKGSDERLFLKKGFNELKRERTDLAQPLRGIKGTKILLFGKQARQRSAEIIDRVLRGMISNPAFRPDQIYSWIARDNQIKLSEKPPGFDQLKSE